MRTLLVGVSFTRPTPGGNEHTLRIYGLRTTLALHSCLSVRLLPDRSGPRNRVP